VCEHALQTRVYFVNVGVRRVATSRSSKKKRQFLSVNVLQNRIFNVLC